MSGDLYGDGVELVKQLLLTRVELLLRGLLRPELRALPPASLVLLEIYGRRLLRVDLR